MTSSSRDESPTVSEVAELVRELRRLTRAGVGADPVEREVFLTAKRELLDRIEASQRL